MASTNTISKIQLPDGNTYSIAGESTVAWGDITGTLSDQSDLNTSLAAKANTSLSNLTDTGYKMMDGQWVAKTATLSTATAVGTYTIDLSSYLPSDNYNYEVLLNLNAFSTNKSATYVYIYSDLIKQTTFAIDVACAAAVSASGYSNQDDILLPLSSTKKVYMYVYNNALRTNCLYLFGYRRIGKNS